MRLLLDTHAFLWAAADPDQLRPNARAAIEDSVNDVLVSAGVAWELSVKVAFGKLTSAGGSRGVVSRTLAFSRVSSLRYLRGACPRCRRAARYSPRSV